MFLLECSEDNSLLIKRNESVICDHATVTHGHVVAFYHKKTKYNGIVKMIADDTSVLKKEIERIKLEDKKSLRNSSTKFNIPTEKQATKRRLTDSLEKLSSKIAKQDRAKVYKTIRNESDDEDYTDEDNTDYVSDDNEIIKSPDNHLGCGDFSIEPRFSDAHKTPVTPTLARSPLKELKTTLKSSRKLSTVPRSQHELALLTQQNRDELADDSKNLDNIEVLINDDDDDSDANLGNFPLNLGMKHIGNGIYCKTADYKNAVKGTPLASAVARNLLLGVFKREVLVQGSVTG
ncbi:hypothetical protein KQX54_002427 [Cotesia glomerata]|uniref:Uncharacterized protein n=1 Tax=Cotesia glomerata TaxID=32391 RepID=A0AAV7I1A1_COTGL|nr:hypothetical protein KQX54_002427 [Cotesia glomerata]